jgi:hypothetical protein
MILMLLAFGYVGVFVADWKRLGLNDEDLRALELGIMERPDAGRVIPGTGGLRKIRFAPPRWKRGKSGAVRVCYVYFARFEWCFMLAAYAKNEQENISSADKAAYRKILIAIEFALSQRRGLL